MAAPARKQEHDPSSEGVAPPPTEATDEASRLADAIDRYYAALTDLKLRYIPVLFDLVILYKLPDVALYVEIPGAAPDLPAEARYRVCRARGTYLSQVELDALARDGVTRLFIRRDDAAPFTQYVEALLSEANTSSPMADEKKVTLLRTSAVQIMVDIFEQPSPQNIERGVKAVSGFVYVLMRDPKAYQLLLTLSSHDHYTLQHSVGVATNAIILAKKIGIDDEKSLIEVGVGGLLHDLGKTKVPKEIINKSGPLDAAEWTEMKKHAMHGYEIVKDNPNVGMRAKLAVLQHHEDSNGTGYPMGLARAQVDLYAKLVAISDIFNAITTDRTYSKAKPPYEAFALIKDKLSHRVDAKLFESMVLIYGGKLG